MKSKILFGLKGLEEIERDITAEMANARAAHPRWPKDPVKRAAIVMEEAGEVIREANHIDEGNGDIADLRAELLQLAGTCIRFLKLIDDEK